MSAHSPSQLESARSNESALASVVISRDGVAEMEGTKRVVFVPQAEVRDLDVRMISGAERPVVTLLAGVVVLVLSLAPIVGLIVALVRNRPVMTKLVFAGAFSPVGVYLIRFALKRRPVLLVDTGKSRRKVLFQSQVHFDDARQFAAEAASRNGYPFASSSHRD